MELEHSFTVPVGIERAWEVLLDVETIAPCMPGAALDTVDGDAFTGTVKVKLGPIGLTYKGKASFVEKDTTAHRAVIDAQGRDARGNGTAKAVVTATLTAQATDSTTVVVATDLAITGKPAQFGRGVMADVGNKLIGQFADCLAGKLAAGDVSPAAVGTSDPVDDTMSDAPDETENAERTGSTADDGGDPGGVSGPGGGGGGSAQGPGNGAPEAESTSRPTSTATAGAAAAPTPTAGSGAVSSAPQRASNGHGPTPSGASPSSGASSGPRTVAPSAAAEPIDLMASAGPAVAKRVAPLAAAALLAVAVVVWLRRR